MNHSESFGRKGVYKFTIDMMIDATKAQLLDKEFDYNNKYKK